MAMVLDELFSNPERLGELSLNAREYAVANYDRRIMANKYLALYGRDPNESACHYQ
jgi:glycosyltransferase involved in cell wall biosynthesis